MAEQETTGENTPAQELQKPVSAARAEKINAGLVAYYEAQQEIEGLKESLAEARIQIREKDLELEARRREISEVHDASEARLSSIESRVHSAVAERDKAVAERAAYEVILVTIAKALEIARLPEPITKAAGREED